MNVDNQENLMLLYSVQRYNVLWLWTCFTFSTVIILLHVKDINAQRNCINYSFHALTMSSHMATKLHFTSQTILAWCMLTGCCVLILWLMTFVFIPTSWLPWSYDHAVMRSQLSTDPSSPTSQPPSTACPHLHRQGRETADRNKVLLKWKTF